MDRKHRERRRRAIPGLGAAVLGAALAAIVPAPAPAQGVGGQAPASKPLLFGERQANKHYETQRVPALEDIRHSLPGLTVHDRLFDRQLERVSLSALPGFPAIAAPQGDRPMSPVVRPDPSPGP